MPIHVLGRLTKTPAVYLSIQDQDVTKSRGAKLRRRGLVKGQRCGSKTLFLDARQSWVPGKRYLEKKILESHTVELGAGRKDLKRFFFFEYHTVGLGAGRKDLKRFFLVPHGWTECRTEERFAKDSMKDSSGYLGRETPKDLETEKDPQKRYRISVTMYRQRFRTNESQNPNAKSKEVVVLMV